MNERKQKLEAVFHAAAELDSAGERERYLSQACAGDHELRREVDDLLKSAEMADAVFQAGRDACRSPEAVPAMIVTEKPGDKIGRYKLLEKIGEGGMGVVYMAEQEEPVRRRVALKIIKLGMDTKSVIARFEAERQALAMMDHPHIAKVLDAGATDSPHNVAQASSPASSPGVSPGVGPGGETPPKPAGGDACATLSAGRPYFVMELVQGVPITEFCDQNQFSAGERLKLFIPVCQAIQSAHQKGIIHRDIKPSNVLVTLNAGLPHPMVIDFGVAKATCQKLTEKTLLTNFATMIGTPAYMSPEQAEMSKLDVDTRSDIYSLGVLLYELLTGTTPFPEKRLRSVAYREMQRIIVEEEPERPSTRLRKTLLGKSEIPNPKSEMDSDLDWIVMKCLEKDRNRRYETANGLAHDIERHLNNEPVVARPPSKLYRLGKLVSRNKLAFAAAGAVTAAILIGLSVSTFLFFKEKASRQRADAASKKSAQVAQFLKLMLHRVGPSVALGRDTTMLREILDETAATVAQELKGQPEVEAELRSLMGEVYRDLGEFEKAGQMHQAALTLWRNLRGDQDADVAKTLSNLGLVYRSQSRMEEAESILRQAVEILTGQFDAKDEVVLTARNNLALVLDERQKFQEAEDSFRQILTIRTNTLGDDSRTADTFNNLAGVRWRQGDSVEAERLHRQALPMRQRLFTAPHPDIAASLSSLGLVLYNQGRYSEAETSHVAAVEMFRKVLPDKHPDLATALNNLALVYGPQGKWSDAEGLFREILAIRQQVLPPAHAHTADTLNNLAWVLQQQPGKQEEAERFHRQALAMRRELWGEHADVVASLNNLALLLRDRGELDEAREKQTEALAMFRRLNLNHPTLEAKFLNTLALILGDQENLAEAEKLHREALATGKAAPPDDVAVWLNNIAVVRERRGDLKEAAELHRQALTLRTNVFGPDHPDVAASLAHLARVLLKQGNAVEAQSLAQACLDFWERKDADDWRTFNARSLLGGSLLGQKKYAEAEPLLLSGYEGLKQREAKIPRPAKPRVREAMERLVQLYETTERPAPAAEWRQKLTEFDNRKP